ncbi:LuxR C-terminal-related transcriptional regulator [Actinoplanes sp. NPDC051475]|uniref:LuxR C-terminal-related transcriptional regulator n=1 Tax=Actinoplanes sp. NPDC051475 TaxID=3157225 RepID=UPI0034508D4E
MAAEIAGIASAPGHLEERAQALLEPLRWVTPYDAGFITLFDPERRQQVPAARQGYTSAVQRFLDSDQFTDDLERVGMQRNGVPVRLTDMPVPPDTLPSWSEHLYPAGFRECLGMGLFSPDGRYLGVVGFNSADARPVSDETCALLYRISPLIARAVDPLRSIAVVGSIVTDAIAGVVVTQAGHSIPLPGLPGHAQLTTGSATLAAAQARLVDGPVHTVFLCPRHCADPDAGLLRVTALACPPQPPGHLTAVVLLSPPPPLHGLTRRELQVLGLLIEGWTNARIAAALTVRIRTITAHIEHVMVKLDATSRTMAAIRAVRAGLYIPADTLILR